MFLIHVCHSYICTQFLYALKSSDKNRFSFHSHNIISKAMLCHKLHAILMAVQYLCDSSDSAIVCARLSMNGQLLVKWISKEIFLFSANICKNIFSSHRSLMSSDFVCSLPSLIRAGAQSPHNSMHRTHCLLSNSQLFCSFEENHWFFYSFLSFGLTWITIFEYNTATKYFCFSIQRFLFSCITV